MSFTDNVLRIENATDLSSEFVLDAGVSPDARSERPQVIHRSEITVLSGRGFACCPFA